MKTRPYLLMNFPPVILVLVFITIAGGTYFWDIGWNDKVFDPLRTLLICFSAFVLGTWRVTAFYPYPGGTYGKWLTLTPWQYGMQMPKGSVQLNISDLAAMAILSATTLLDRQIHFLVPVFIFLYVYILTAITATINGISETKYWHKRLLILVIIPTAFYPFPSMTSLIVSVAVCYLLCYLHLRDLLKAFPWNQSFWLEKDEDILARKSLKYAETGWPFSALAATDRKFFSLSSKSLTIIVLSGLLVWWVHSIAATLLNINGDDEVGILTFVLVIAGVIAISIRLFFLQGTAPPISFWGRIFNGFFIIPQYDKIFVAPLIILAVVIGTVYWIGKCENAAIWLFDGSLWVITVVCAGFPPGMNQWRSTGWFRAVRSSMLEKQLQQLKLEKTGLNKPISELFTGK